MKLLLKRAKGILKGCVLGSVCIATACGNAKSKNEVAAESATVGELLPSDSSGSQGAVSLAFGATATGVALSDEMFELASSIDAGTGITLTSAKMNIASIKIKPSKILTDSEKLIDEDEAKDDEATKKADETAMDEQKVIKEQVKELAKLSDEAERKKKKTEFEAKLSEYKKKRVEAAKENEVELLEKAQKRDKNLRWKGPFTYDLVTNTMSPALNSATIPDGSYERIELKLKPLRGTDTSDPLLNNTIYVSGSVVINGTTRNFEVFLHQCEEIKLYGNSKIKIEANGSANIAINFDPQTWLSGVDFTNAALNSDGTITIDRDNNTSIFKTIRKNFKKSVIFGKNSRGDGRIASSEAVGDSKADASEKDAKEQTSK